jgi:cytochrome P450
VDTQHVAPGCPFRIDSTAADIHAEGAALNALGPATWVELPGGVEAWSVTDTALAKRLLTDRRISKDAYQHWPAYMEGEIADDWPLRIWVDARNALTAYGDEHTRLRRLIGPAFSARRVRGLAPAIEEIVGNLLDTLAAHKDGAEIDLKAEFAWTLPILVINTMLGVPAEMTNSFRENVGGLFDTDVSAEQAAANGASLYGHLAALIAAKRESPGDDVTSALIAARDDETGTALSEQQLLDSLMLLIAAGHETTVNLIDHSVTHLLTHPDQLALVREGKAAWKDVVEETLRVQAPIANIVMRFAVEDIEDAETGLRFARGDTFVINYAAIGRDPAVHSESPELFDVTRENKEHLAFGFGTHFCLGAELARLELRIALPALFERFPDLALSVPADELRPAASFISNGHRSLPVVLRPEPAAVPTA